MADLLFNGQTLSELKDAVRRKPHAIVLTGTVGAGKLTAAKYLLSEILSTDMGRVTYYPHVSILQPVKDVISIDIVRQLHEFTKLKTTGTSQIRRGVILADAHKLTHEAQNALLKLLEEPPADTVIILTATDKNALLPTIMSRAQEIRIKALSLPEINRYFDGKGGSKQIERAYYISGGQIGLLTALLENDESHELISSISQAKELLTTDVFSRLCKIDYFAKKKEALEDLLYALQQVCHAALEKAAKDDKNSAIKKWHNALRILQFAKDNHSRNAQPKLLLTDLFLNL